MSTNVQGTLTQLQNATAQVQFKQGQANLGTTNMDQGSFLNLLMAQLKYQDPMNPMDNQSFVAEQAQFTQIEKLDTLNSTLTQANQISQGSALVGKTVQVQQSDGTTASGRVDSVSIGADGSAALSIGGTNYAMSSVSQIFAPSN